MEKTKKNPDSVEITNTNKPENPNTTVFNLIILDESGSMEHLTDATISGCNEVLNTIYDAARENKDKQRQLVSIYAFQSGSIPSRYLLKYADGSQHLAIGPTDYKPWGGTPLYDAVGSTISELLAVTQTHEDAVGIVTIITDGYENSSRQYSGKQVANLISEVREMGWTVNIIGANIDVTKMAQEMNIDTANSLKFSADQTSTRDMFQEYSRSVHCKLRELNEEEPEMRIEERRALRKSRANNFFDRGSRDKKQ